MRHSVHIYINVGGAIGTVFLSSGDSGQELLCVRRISRTKDGNDRLPFGCRVFERLVVILVSLFAGALDRCIVLFGRCECICLRA